MQDRIYNFNEGEFLLIDKPLNWTSFDVVNKIRNNIRCKVGHGGTLDPLATGLLLIATGKHTKKLNDVQQLSKEYEGTFTLGSTTPSYDLETGFDAFFEYNHITEADIHATSQKFTGDLIQRPPLFSAIKVNGSKMYEKARAKEHFEVPERNIHISEFEITAINLPQIEFRVKCSKGTYVRSLAFDFGKALNSGAHLSSLRRTAIGSFQLSEAWNLDDFINFVQMNHQSNANPQGHPKHS